MTGYDSVMCGLCVEWAPIRDGELETSSQPNIKIRLAEQIGVDFLIIRYLIVQVIEIIYDIFEGGYYVFTISFTIISG